jgi:hypothetical protein
MSARNDDVHSVAMEAKLTKFMDKSIDAIGKALDAGVCPDCLARLHLKLAMSIAEIDMEENPIEWLQRNLDEIKRVMLKESSGVTLQ